MWFRSRAVRACGQPLDQGWALQKRLYFGLLLALAAAAPSFGLDGAGKQARSETRTAPSEAARPATFETRPIPEAGPLAQPKSLDQVGLPAELTRQAIPADNPQTPEKIALGEKLFFDGRLSADGSVACSTCHDPARAFTDGKPTLIGVKGRVGQRNSPTILNAFYNKTQFWDGRVNTLEQQAALPIVNPIEMGQPSMDAAVARIAAIEEYHQIFQEVSGHPPNGADLVRAIVSYERTQVSFDSPLITSLRGIGTPSTIRRSAAGSFSTPRVAAINAIKGRFSDRRGNCCLVGAIDFVSSHHAIKGNAAERYLAAAISDERGQRICSNENGQDYARLRAALRRAMRGEWYRASETLLRRDSLSDFNDGCKDFAELRALIVQARATAMNDGDPGPARRPNFDIVRDELVMA